MKIKLFVYGTLKRGFGLNAYLKTSKFLGQEKVKGYTLYSNGGFPYMVKSDKDFVYGEVYEVESEIVMDTIDLIESAYRREKVIGERFGESEAYIYYNSVEGLAHIKKIFI